jgi:hypothetical protein
MRAFGFLAALVGTAAAAPFTMDLSPSSSNIRRAPTNPNNEYTRLDMSKPEKVTVREKDLVKGVYHSDKTVSVAKTQIKAPVEQTIKLKLVNNIGGENLNCYISGADSEGKVFFLGEQANLIYPSSGGSAEPVPVEDPIAIKMPPQGETFEITVPIAFSSGRIYFAQGELEFFMVAIDGGDGLVQPSISSLEDPSRNINWGFVEMTLTEDGEIWANISYVDFVGLIMSMTLNNKDNSTQEVIGLPSDAVGTVCEALKAQGDADGKPWGAMCVATEDGTPIRILSPEDFAEVSEDGFGDYWNQYIDDVWAKYSSEPLTINTQADAGDVKCQVEGEELKCDGDNRGYPKPDIMDIWGCNSGPFSVLEGDNDVHKAVVPRLCAAFNRATYDVEGGNYQPGPGPDKYYTVDPTNHYSRIIHENEVDGRGYAFPYDDVNPDGAEDAAGLVASLNHEELIFYVGGAQ